MDWDDFKELASCFGFVFGIIFVVLALIGVVALSLGYYQGCQEARVFNRMNGTEWTCADFMWAGEQINGHTITIRRGQ